MRTLKIIRPHFKPYAEVLLYALPPEIRRKIFEYVLLEFKQIEIGFWSRKGKGKSCLVRRPHLKLPGDVHWFSKVVEPKRMSLLLVNRSTRIEASQVFYSKNQFSFKTMTILNRFLNTIGTSVQHLCFLDISTDGYSKTASCRLFVKLAEAKRLQKLRFTHYDFCEGQLTRTPNRAMLIRDGRKLFESLQQSYRAQGLKGSASQAFQISTECKKRWYGANGIHTESCQCKDLDVFSNTRELENYFRCEFNKG